MFKLSKKSKSHLLGVDKSIELLVDRVLKVSPYDFGIPNHGGLRTHEEQNRLYQIGRSVELDRSPVTNIDGYRKHSIHQSGHAFDIFIYYNGRACWDCIDKYVEVADIIKDIFNSMQNEGYFINKKLTWGGNWTRFKDYPHFQITEV